MEYLKMHTRPETVTDYTHLPVCVGRGGHIKQVTMNTTNRWGSALIFRNSNDKMLGRAFSSSSN